MRIEEAKNFFFDPISGQRMRDPYQNNNCGHAFEKLQIEGWRGRSLQTGGTANCPLCKAPLGSLIGYRLLKQALDILYSPTNADLHNIEDLTDEEHEKVENVVAIITQRRTEDQKKGIPNKLAQPESFLTKALDFSSKACCSSK